MKDDDDEDSWLLDQATLQARRLYGDIIFYIPGFNWFDFDRIIRNPTMALNTLEQVIKFISQLVTDPLEEYQRKVGMYEKGDLKIKKKFDKAIPIFSKVESILYPDVQLQFYNMDN